LFFSPAERTQIDESRRRPSVVAAAEPKPLPPAPEYVTLNGVVRRSDGTTSIWINNRMLVGRRTSEGLEVNDSKRAPGAANVTVRVPQAGRSVDMRVGQQLEVTSGKVQERYQLAPATEPAAPSAAAPSSADTARSPMKPAPRRASKDRDMLRELLRDMEGPSAERAAPPAAPKG
jgi:hypothetical protein